VPLTLTRSVMVILVPGVVALAPWLLLTVRTWPRLMEAYAAYEAASNAMLFATVVVVGSVLEGFASWIEVRWDQEREKEFEVRKHWIAYLSRVGPEPVGHRYISRMVTTLYFELSMLFATPLFFFGSAVLAQRWGAPLALPVSVAAVALVAIIYFRLQARSTHKVLCEVRRDLAGPRPETI
jgi:hypothetical protein